MFFNTFATTFLPTNGESNAVPSVFELSLQISVKKVKLNCKKIPS